MPSEEALQVAALAWALPSTQEFTIDSVLSAAFAEILDRIWSGEIVVNRKDLVTVHEVRAMYLRLCEGTNECIYGHRPANDDADPISVYCARGVIQGAMTEALHGLGHLFAAMALHTQLTHPASIKPPGA